uniref:Large ribosomal subunit protein uL24c n=1 Tax=Anotrichium furcellatum TaxID=41999 RepID=A0A4D6WM65_9FLOR|nr:ribosomal protein L24 [Anotrichium furcellatum]
MKKKLKININKGQIVKIISGKYKGQIGEVKKVIYKHNSLIIENINIKIKHFKPKQSEETGEIRNIETPIHRSNVKLSIE